MLPYLVFFDGVCSLCNGAVDWLLIHDRKAIFHFASLQGETAASLLPLERRTQLDTIVLREPAGQLWVKSEAVLRIAAQLPYPWRLFAWFRGVPRSWRDCIYDALAHRRYQIFGRRSSCRILAPHEEPRFRP